MYVEFHKMYVILAVVCNLRGVEYVWIFVFPEKSQDKLLNVLYTYIFLTLLRILPIFAFHLEKDKS